MPDKPEILAPAGNIEAFHAAVEAGADAVYLGLRDYSARVRAENFSIEKLSWIIPYAESNGVKVYPALNTLLKQHEIVKAVKACAQLMDTGAAGVIAADPGLIRILAARLPGLEIHASTQMTLHNSCGVEEMLEMGIKRVILSREITLKELKRISKVKGIELEIFTEGALCYSISGLCLASSFLGGHSGNRGRCTQVCRRSFLQSGKRRAPFSLKDLSLMDYISEIMSCGVRSLKIEGRMKSAEYIYAMVSLYRSALNCRDSGDDEIVRKYRDFGREKTPFYFDGDFIREMVASVTPNPSGVLIGRIRKVSGNTAIVPQSGTEPDKGDRISVYRDFEREEVRRILSVSRAGSDLSIEFDNGEGLRKGDYLFVTGRSGLSGRFRKVRYETEQRRVKEHKSLISKAAEVSRGIKGFTPEYSLIIRVDNPEWPGLERFGNDTLILIDLDLESAGNLLKGRHPLTPERAALALPPWIPEQEVSPWKKLSEKLLEKGYNTWTVTGIGQERILPQGVSIYTDSTIGTLNNSGLRWFMEKGRRGYFYPVEDDFLNTKAVGSGFGVFTLYSRPALFISRVKPAVSGRESIKDTQKREYLLKERSGLYYLVPENPVCLTHRRSKLEKSGIRCFCMDLRFFRPGRKKLESIMNYFTNEIKEPGSESFNHKSGLK